MTKIEFQKLLRQTDEQMLQLTKSKGEEYARSDDQLANFKRSAAANGISTYAAWGVLYGKHVDAIQYFIQNGRELSEPIESRIYDAILYLNLLLALVKESKDGAQK